MSILRQRSGGRSAAGRMALTPCDWYWNTVARASARYNVPPPAMEPVTGVCEKQIWPGTSFVPPPTGHLATADGWQIRRLACPFRILVGSSRPTSCGAWQAGRNGWVKRTNSTVSHQCAKAHSAPKSGTRVRHVTQITIYGDLRLRHRACYSPAPAVVAHVHRSGRGCFIDFPGVMLVPSIRRPKHTWTY